MIRYGTVLVKNKKYTSTTVALHTIVLLYTYVGV